MCRAGNVLSFLITTRDNTQCSEKNAWHTFEFLTTMLLQTEIFCDVTPCQLVNTGYGRFE